MLNSLVVVKSKTGIWERNSVVEDTSYKRIVGGSSPLAPIWRLKV